MDWLKDIREFVFVEDEPQTACALVIAGNTWPQPAMRAAQIYRQGLVSLIIPSGRYSKERGYFPGPSAFQDRFAGSYETEADFLTDVLKSGGVPEEAILPDREATFTLENAVNAKRILDERGLVSGKLIVCCQAYHARRCKMYFEYVFRKTEMEILICPAVTDDIDRDNWTRSERGLAIVLGEVEKCGKQFSWMINEDMVE